MRAGSRRRCSSSLISWSKIAPHDVFRTDVPTLARVALGWATDLSLGELSRRARGRSLLVSTPLRALLTDCLDMAAVHENVGRGLVRGVALTTTSYRANLAVTFFDGVEGIQPWGRSTRIGVRQRLTIDHVMASSAIPVFFPAVPIGGKYYADGCVRLTTPLGPAVHLGADRILAIGVRWAKPPDPDSKLPSGADDPYPTMAETAGMLMNAVFLEALEGDIERFERINRTVSLLPRAAIEHERSPLRSIPLLVLRPSRNLALLAAGAIGVYRSCSGTSSAG